MNSKTIKALVGGGIAFVIATACCWLPAILMTIGGATGIAGLSNGLNAISIPFMIIGILIIGVGIYNYYQNKEKSMEVQLISTITCPECQHVKEETMPTDACQYFYECERCKTVLKPINNDCCVYCSYGTVACPPIQMDEACC